MAFINTDAYDAALDWIRTNGTRLDICSAEPADYAAVATDSLGHKTSLSIGADGAGTPSGRKVTVAAITDGTVTATDTAAYWAITDGSSVLVATGPLASSQDVTSGNTFTLAAFDITFPAATSA
ncbi:MAG TPA: hypothetical protein VHW02_07955 [Rhizomicrobium sp.]|jgi:hypothetical protein|nr:hypothetical protein [Rhizomicrobium sp.]